MKAALYFLLTAAAAALYGQQIAGKVVNSVNGEPIRRAMVIARAQDTEHGPSYAAETDSHGQFSIGDMEPGSYLVSAERQGFHFQARGATGAPPPPLKLDRGQEMLDLLLRLIPTGVIAGRVTDDEGDPVRGAEVQAFVTAYVNGKKQLNSVDTVMSNEKGEYRLFGLTPGTFYVQASARDMRAQQNVPIRGAHPPEKPAPAYYPGVSDQNRAVPIEVAAGAELRGFDIRLSRQKTYSVRFKVTPGPNQGYWAMIGDGRNWGSGVSVNGDTAEVPGLTPGSHVVTIVQNVGDEQNYARVPVEIVDADVDGGALTFLPQMDVTGAVRADDKKTHPWENIRVGLRSETEAPNGFQNASGFHNTTVNADGSFALRKVPPDVYRVTAQFSSPVPGTYVKSIGAGDHDLADWKLDLTKETAPLNILLGTDVGAIEGIVKNAAGDPVVRARVNLIPGGGHAGRTDLTKFTFTDEKGEFNFKTVAPAQYRIFAWEDVPVGKPQDPEFRKRFETRSVLVKVEPDSHQKVEATAIPAAEARKP